MSEIDVILVGEQGPAGPGVPLGGSPGQFLKKSSNGNFDTEWTDSSASVQSINDVNDVSVSQVTEGQILVWDDAQKVWRNDDNVASGGGGSWGGITGTLSDQTDLQSELDGKATNTQGAKADSALQPGNNVSQLVNDVGYNVDIVETIQTTGNAPTTIVSIPVPEGELRIIRIALSGIDSATKDSAWKYMRLGSKTISDVTSIVGGVSTDLGYDQNASEWDMVTTVSSGSIMVTVTGEIGKTIDWNVHVEIK